MDAAKGGEISSEGASTATLPRSAVVPARLRELVARIGGIDASRSLWVLGITLGALGMLSRFVLAWLSIGCNDATGWQTHARLIRAHGVRYAYENTADAFWKYNHPPLMGYWSAFADWASRSHFRGFSLWMKAPGLVVELVSAWLVYRIIAAKHGANAGAFAFAAYGLSLTMILVSGYHCNTDAAYAGLTLLAVYLMQERERPFSSGLALAAALNVKLMPIFLVPPILALCRSRRDVVRFGCGLALFIVPFIPFLVTSGRAILKNVVSYNSVQIDWGVIAFLNHAAASPALAAHVATLKKAAISNARYWILGAVIVLSAISALRRQKRGYELGALAWALFLVLTPGYGVQYSVCVLPLLFVADRARAIAYSFFAGIMLLLVYTVRMQWVLPLQASVQYYPYPPLALLSGVLAWGTLASFVVVTARKIVTGPREG